MLLKRKNSANPGGDPPEPVLAQGTTPWNPRVPAGVLAVAPAARPSLRPGTRWAGIDRFAVGPRRCLPIVPVAHPGRRPGFATGWASGRGFGRRGGLRPGWRL